MVPGDKEKKSVSVGSILDCVGIEMVSSDVVTGVISDRPGSNGTVVPVVLNFIGSTNSGGSGKSTSFRVSVCASFPSGSSKGSHLTKCLPLNLNTSTLSCQGNRPSSRMPSSKVRVACHLLPGNEISKLPSPGTENGILTIFTLLPTRIRKPL